MESLLEFLVAHFHLRQNVATKEPQFGFITYWKNHQTKFIPHRDGIQPESSGEVWLIKEGERISPDREGIVIMTSSLECKISDSPWITINFQQRVGKPWLWYSVIKKDGLRIYLTPDRQSEIFPSPGKTRFKGYINNLCKIDLEKRLVAVSVVLQEEYIPLEENKPKKVESKPPAAPNPTFPKKESGANRMLAKHRIARQKREARKGRSPNF
jgi:hypothetical protein